MDKMKYKKALKKLLLLTIGLWFGASYAQSNCSDLLIEANKAYNQGKHEQVIRLLESQINQCNFDKLEKEQAIKLLASSMNMVDEVEAADSLVYQLLKKNPNYQIQSTIDPKPFVLTLDKFERSPRSVFGVSLGYSTPFIQSENTYGVWDEADYSSSYNTESSLSFALNYQYFISKKFSLGLEPEISSLKFSRTINAQNLAEVNYSEKANLVKVPLLLGYEVYSKKDFSTTLRAGLYGSYAWGFQYDVNYQLPESGSIAAAGELVNQRNAMNYGYQLGADFAYTKNRLRFSAKLDYANDLKLYNNPDNRYSENNTLLDYNYVDNNIKMSNLGVKLGVAYTLSYKIKHKYRSK